MSADADLLEIIRTGILIYIAAMLPMIAARGAIVMAAALGVSWPAAYILASAGASTAAALVLRIDRDTLEKLRRFRVFDDIFATVDRHIEKHRDKIGKRGIRTLFMLVAVPFSGVGVIVACLIAKLLDLEYRSAAIGISAGVFVNCFFTTAAVYGLLTGVRTLLTALL